MAATATGTEYVFHLLGRDDEGCGAPVPRDGDGFALHRIEELAKFILGFDGRKGDDDTASPR